MIEKLKKKKTHLNNKIKKYQLKDDKIDNDQEDLKFIDFHQLQIENKKFNKELHEKNIKLAEIKQMTTEIHSKLT